LGVPSVTTMVEPLIAIVELRNRLVVVV